MTVDTPASHQDARNGPTPLSVRTLVVGVLLGAIAVALVAGAGQVDDAPALFAALVAACLLLDRLGIDVFERAHVSPASVPILVLACLFGPVGPFVAEVVSAVVARITRRDPVLKLCFDVGSLGLAGATAAGSYAALAPSSPVAVVGAAALAGLGYYVVNIALLSVVTALSAGEHPLAVWRESFLWLWPHYLGFGVIAGGLIVFERDYGLLALLLFAAPLAVLWIAEQQYVDRSRESVEALRRNRDELQAANTELRRLLDENSELLGSVQRSYLSTITSLARTIEAKDPYTGGHTERVSQLALMLARELGFKDHELRAIEVGGAIHDIGKIGVSDHILTKPGRLDDDEFAEMRRHPEISSYIVSELDLPEIVKDMVRSHHERFDGDGYPDGLAGQDIPLAARILAVADTLDAMTSDRSYRAALTLDAAVAEIRRNAGTQFCPLVVAAFVACLTRDPSLDGQFPAPVAVEA
jgi:putative nucleotidyltransferase with HDIG domain